MKIIPYVYLLPVPFYTIVLSDIKMTKYFSEENCKSLNFYSRDMTFRNFVFLLVVYDLNHKTFTGFAQLVVNEINK